jgi:hypothetical protein
MKHSYRSFVLFCLLILSFALLPQFARAIGNPEDPGDDPDAPIDGGVGLLVAAGVVYGIKRIKDERKKKAGGGE